MFKLLSRIVIAFVCLVSSAQAAIQVVAAENVYGELAKQLGGHWVEVDSIIANPNQDPHLFSATPKVAKKISQAQLIIMNGAGYDSWMEKLLPAKPNSQQQVLNVANLVKAEPGANPHLWYRTANMLLVAKRLTEYFIQHDAEHQSFFQEQQLKFAKRYQMLQQKISSLQQRYSGTPVVATEPVFDYMAQALGLKMQGQGLQQSIMNDVEPSPLQLKEVEDLIVGHKVQVLFFNKQVVSPLTQRLKSLAQKQHISVVGVTETQPADLDYVRWMLLQLEQLQQALSHAA